jgi:integrase
VFRPTGDIKSCHPKPFYVASIVTQYRLWVTMGNKTVGKQLTDARVRALTAKSARYEVWDKTHPGFGVRVGVSGKKSWVTFYWTKDGAARKQRRVTLGQYPAMGLAEAHEAHSRIRRLVEEKKDPAAQLAAAKAGIREAETIGDLVAAYVKDYAKAKKAVSSAKEDERILNKDVIPVWGHRVASSITREDVLLLLDQVTKRGPVIGNRTRVLLHTVFSFAIRHRTAFKTFASAMDNPVALITGEREWPKTRVLDERELIAFWRCVSTVEGIDEVIRLAVLFVLVTAQRPGEVAGMRFDEIDSQGVWRLPPERTKKRRLHLVPLSDLALWIVEECRQSHGGEYVFPSPRKDDAPIRRDSLMAGMRRVRHLVGLDDVTNHDLRRTAATGMAALGVEKHTRRHIMNQRDGDVHSEVYDQFEYIPEKRAALELWAAHIIESVKGDS